MVKRCLIFILMELGCYAMIYSQAKKSLFRNYTIKEIPQNKFGEILVLKDGKVLISTSEYSFAIITGGNMGGFTIGLDNQDYGIKNLKSVFTGAPVKTMAESTDNNIFFSTPENQVTYFKNTEQGICDLPPFYFPIKGDSPKQITKLWFDEESNLYIGVTDGAFYIVPKAGLNASLDPAHYKIGRTADSNMVILKGEIAVQKIKMEEGAGVYSFAENITNKNITWLGTTRGLFYFNKITGAVNKVLAGEGKMTITHIETLANGDTWFSTLEKGMGVYHQVTMTKEFFSIPIQQSGPGFSYPIQDFCIKSADEFFVAVRDSLPAIFNIRDGSYKFMDDPCFVLSKNTTTSIRLDSTGNFYIIKGGLLYSAHLSDNPEWIGQDSNKIAYTPLIYGVTDFNNREIANYLVRPELLKKLKLKYNENSIIIYITSNYFSKYKRSQYAWSLEGDISNWVQMPAFDENNDSSNRVELPGLKPGKYTFHVRVKVGDAGWSGTEAKMEIIIVPPYWTTWWFWSVLAVALSMLVYMIIKLRVNAIRKAVKLKAGYEKELLELEAKALRAQMNPHFVFNCLNSIKALMQANENEKGVTYLTTFSKLIRTLFNNADKKHISLHDEIETCKFYLQLEAMRFDSRFSYSINVDEDIDLKSVQVPALIIQPFIENAIWHGIMPKEDGGTVTVTVERKEEGICCTVEDDGIGREISLQNKFRSGLSEHRSKGVHLAESRLDLDNLLNERSASITITDKKDNQGKATGTSVVLMFTEY